MKHLLESRPRRPLSVPVVSSRRVGHLLKKPLDPSLYLVVSTDSIPPGATLQDVVEQSIRSGVTLVQLREKKASTAAFLRTAQVLKQITARHHVPLLINDRIDVALAVDADGVHVGQSDMPAGIARRLLGRDKILGVTVSNASQALQAFKDGADYLGTDPIYPSITKTDSLVLGITNFRKICECTSLPVVGIGGIGLEQVEEVISCGASGIAVVSAICSAPNVPEATSQLKQLILSSLPTYSTELSQFAAECLEKIRLEKPLIQHLTNYVVMNQTANVTIQAGARPVMAHENAQITPFAKAVVLNTGTLDDQWISAMHLVGRQANQLNIPIVFDPVGIGATEYRTNQNFSLLNSLKMRVLKGNPGEIASIAGEKETVSGVDSISNPKDPHLMLSQLAMKYKTTVAMTGKRDVVSDGHSVYEVHNNEFFLSQLTGTGCNATAIIAAFVAVSKEEDTARAVASGLAYYAHAAEVASQKAEGPGTFYHHLLDALFHLSPQDLYQNAKIVAYHANPKQASL